MGKTRIEHVWSTFIKNKNRHKEYINSVILSLLLEKMELLLFFIMVIK